VTAATKAGNNELTLDLHLFLAAIDEGEGRLNAALERLESARPLTRPPASDVCVLRLYTARIRVRRLLGAAYDREREELIAAASPLLTQSVRRQVRGRPALLRELVAEFGEQNTELLRDALEIVGLEIVDDLSRSRFVREFLALDQPLLTYQQVDVLVAAARAKGSQGWASKILDALGGAQGIVKFALDLTGTPAATSIARLITPFFQRAVAASVLKRVPRSGRPVQRTTADAEKESPESTIASWLGAPVSSNLTLEIRAEGGAPASRVTVKAGDGSVTQYPYPRDQQLLEIKFPRVDAYNVRVSLTFASRDMVLVSAHMVRPDGKQFQSEFQKRCSGAPGELVELTFIITTE
jgi:hypothetical protein